MTKDTPIECSRNRDGEECSFVLQTEVYGTSVAVRGACTVHDNGGVVISLAVTNERDRQTLYRPPPKLRTEEVSR